MASLAVFIFYCETELMLSRTFVDYVDCRRSGVIEIEATSVPSRVAAGALLVDVREDREWSLGHAVGAVHVARGVLERDIEQAVPNREQELLLYCGGGLRSVLAVKTLQELGYTNASSIKGGWAQLEVELRVPSLAREVTSGTLSSKEKL